MGGYLLVAKGQSDLLLQSTSKQTVLADTIEAYLGNLPPLCENLLKEFRGVIS